MRKDPNPKLCLIINALLQMMRIVVRNNLINKKNNVIIFIRSRRKKNQLHRNWGAEGFIDIIIFKK